MSNSPVVFWDFDGTLAARTGGWPEVLYETVRAAVPSSPVQLEDLAVALRHGFPDYGPGGLHSHPGPAAWWAATSGVLHDACTAAGVDLPGADRAVREVPQQYYDVRAWSVMPGATQALETTTRAGFRNAILSNHAPELPQLVHELGFTPFVERTITSAALGVEKPDKAMFLLAQHISRATPDSWMIGDDPAADIAGARAAGMRAVLVHRRIGDEPAGTLRGAAAEVSGNRNR